MINIKRQIYRILLIFLIVQVIFSIHNVSEAGAWSDIFTQGDDFLNQGVNQMEQGSITINTDNGTITLGLPSDSKIKSTISNIFNVIFPLGVVITVIVGGILGIKFMLASAEDKAKIKESLVPYVAGCIVIYGAFGIWKLAIEIFSGMA